MDGMWLDWIMSTKNAGELASYVNPEETRGFLPANCQVPWTGSRAGRERGQRLYEALLGHRIVYALQPWNPTGLAQRIRSPQQAVQGPATCLDLALVLAGMAIGADMRPLIALRTSDPPHAAILLDVRTPISAPSSAAKAAIPSCFTEDQAEPGVWNLSPGAVGAGMPELSVNWQMVDVARAARQVSGISGVLADAGDALDLRGDSNGDEFGQDLLADGAWILVDVIRVLRYRPACKPPQGNTAPAIHGYLPAFPAFRFYRSRADLWRQLWKIVGPEKSPGIVVLQAPSGFGKSMLAHQLALGADNGCGWVLNATDGQVLTRSLAQAERRERREEALRGDPAGTSTNEKPDAGEDSALAAEALDRLRDAQRPWVVVLDNCDSPPTAQGLGGLVPRPRRAGQFVIITTTNADWQVYAQDNGWRFVELPALVETDLDDLHLLPAVHRAIGGRPLVAEALDALQGRAVKLPERVDVDGADLVWSLIRGSGSASDDAVELARLLAWCPPEPMGVAGLPTVAYADAANDEASSGLAALSFVSLASGPAGPTVQLHRKFAAAVRDQAWSDDPAAAADVISRLLTTPEGLECFIAAADSTSLARLEQGASGETARAAKQIGASSRVGLLWYGLGHIRERRGPVRASQAHFTEALKDLDSARYPYEVADSMIGQARQIFQDSSSTNVQLAEAREIVEQARSLLEPLDHPVALQLREQGNALLWLITQKMVARERDPKKRKILLEEVRENLWLSYLERLRIVRTPEAAITREAPVHGDGLGAERAFYNLAGVNIQLAKTNHELAARISPAVQASGPAEGSSPIGDAAAALDEAGKVFEVVRGLRELRYGGRAHPHLASCIQGQATVAYFRAVLLGDLGSLPDSIGFAALAMEQRRKVAGGLAGPGSELILRDGDVGKSIDFTIKVAVAAAFARQPTAAEGAKAALNVFREATVEWLGRPA